MAFRAVAAGLAVAVFALAGFSPAFAAPVVGGTASWTLVGLPAVTVIGQTDAAVVYQNNLNTTVLGIVIMVLHNTLGQTVLYSAATLTIAPGANLTAYDVVYDIPSGTYSATFFAMLPSGAAISNATVATLTVP